MNLTVRCVGNGEVTVVALHYDLAAHRIRLAELVATADVMVQRRVNPEVLDFDSYPELDELFDNNWQWDMEAVEDLVVGYLNRQSEARVRLHHAWAAEVAQA